MKPSSVGNIIHLISFPQRKLYTSPINSNVIVYRVSSVQALAENLDSVKKIIKLFYSNIFKQSC